MTTKFEWAPIAQGSERFLLWLGMNFCLGLLPTVITVLVYVLTNGQTDAVRVEDLMFFIIMLIATTMFDMVLERLRGPTGMLVWPVLLLFVVIAAFFLGTNVYHAAALRQGTAAIDPPRLRLLGLVLTFFATLVSVSVEVYLCFFMRKNSKLDAEGTAAEDTEGHTL